MTIDSFVDSEMEELFEEIKREKAIKLQKDLRSLVDRFRSDKPRVHIEATALNVYSTLNSMYSSWDRNFDKSDYENAVESNLVYKVLDLFNLSSKEKRSKHFFKKFLEPYVKSFEQTQIHNALTNPYYAIEVSRVEQLYDSVSKRVSDDPYFKEGVARFFEFIDYPMPSVLKDCYSAKF